MSFLKLGEDLADAERPARSTEDSRGHVRDRALVHLGVGRVEPAPLNDQTDDRDSALGLLQRGVGEVLEDHLGDRWAAVHGEESLARDGATRAGADQTTGSGGRRNEHKMGEKENAVALPEEQQPGSAGSAGGRSRPGRAGRQIQGHESRPVLAGVVW